MDENIFNFFNKNQKKISVEYQLNLNKEFIQESLDDGLNLSEIYQYLSSQNKLKCSYESFRRVAKKLFFKKLETQKNTTLHKKTITSPTKAPGFAPVPNPDINKLF